MTPSTVTAIVVIAVVAGVIITLAMILKFLWRIYERGGPSHVSSVAKALHEVYDPQWPSKVLGYLPSDIDKEKDEKAANEDTAVAEDREDDEEVA